MAASTHVTADGPYGASRSLLFDWTTAAAQYRKRHHMRRGSTLQVLADDWALAQSLSGVVSPRPEYDLFAAAEE